jgi:serine/threonine protein kinase
MRGARRSVRISEFQVRFGGSGARVYTERVEAGRRIGKYVLDERIAVGGMAEVWAARAEGREGFVKPVALKFILESFSGDPELERLFVNEARIAARLQHANLVTVFDFDKVDADDERGIAGRYYIAMERVDGRDLRHVLEAMARAGRPLAVGVTLHVAGEMLKALRYVHDKREGGVALGLVHRDVSPHNVLVGYAGEVKLSDFGIAKAREHSARTTKPGSLRGKIAYASPEQLAGGVVDHRTDQFAAGATIWEMLAGRRLFDGASDLEIIGKVARCEIPPLGVGAGVPAGVEAVVRRMLAADPGARFATTGDALSAVLAAPGYSPDGAPLGQLVRKLFPSRAFASSTLPIAFGAAAGAGDPTRTMDDAVVGPAPDLGVGAALTPTRQARRTSEALARSPDAGGGEGGTTTDVRSRRGAAAWVTAIVVVAAIAAGFVARHRLGLGGAAPAETPLARSEPQAPVEASPVPAAAEAAPVKMPAPAAAPAFVAPPAPDLEHPVKAAKPPSHAARGAASERRRSSRHANEPSEAATPPVAAPPRAPDAPAIKRSANGAPIIE